MTALVYVGLGSNVEREFNLRNAVSEMRQGFGELQLSPVYDSAAVGFEGCNFLNLVAGFNTDLGVEAVVQNLRAIEDKLGRDRNQPMFSRRTIDLDILTYDALIMDQGGIQIPRREILSNGFVLKPLRDLAPETLHPEIGESYKTIWAQMAPDAPTLDEFPLNFE